MLDQISLGIHFFAVSGVEIGAFLSQLGIIASSVSGLMLLARMRFL
ncbi:MAG: hypothetical protein V7711_02025 [Pseudomonadales bacterium]